MSDTRNTVIEYALKNEGNLEIAYETHRAYNDICEKIAKAFLYKLKDRLEKTLNNDNWIFPEIESTEKITFLIRNENWTEDTSFGIKDFNDNDRACFGVTTDPENQSILFTNIQKELQGRITGFGWWAHLRSPYNKWNESFDGLKSIYEPSHLLDYVEVNILKLKEIIEEYFNRK